MHAANFAQCAAGGELRGAALISQPLLFSVVMDVKG